MLTFINPSGLFCLAVENKNKMNITVANEAVSNILRFTMTISYMSKQL